MVEFQPDPNIAANLDPGGPGRFIPGGREGLAGYSGHADSRQWFHQFTFTLDPRPNWRAHAPALCNSAAAMDISSVDALLVTLAGT